MDTVPHQDPVSFASTAGHIEAPLANSWPPPPHSPDMPANKFFFGRFGFRAGYGIAIFIALYLLIATVAGFFAVALNGQWKEYANASIQAKAHPDRPKLQVVPRFTPILAIAEDGITFLGLLGICWFFSRAERRPFRSYGIGAYRFSDVFTGAFFGIALLSLVVFVLYASHLLVFDGRALHGPAILGYGLSWLFAFLLVGFAEEYSFRGYLQYTLMRGVWGLAELISARYARPIAFWIAATILSLVFAFVHKFNGGETFFGLVQVFLAGIAFSYALWRTGSLWWGIGFHMTWDWAQSFLFGVADSGNISLGRLFITHPQGKPILSGGSAGPEGSIYASVAFLLAILIIHLVAKPGIQPALEQQPKLQELPAPRLYPA